MSSYSNQNTILSLKARQIFDSRGDPTLEVDVVTEKGLFRASVPSSPSTGEYEARELLDENPKEFLGKGVSKAVRNVNDIIAPELIGKDVTKQTEIDEFMVQKLDGTKSETGWAKSKLGANAILGVSLALCRAGAAGRGVPLYQYIADLACNKELVLPVPAFIVLTGGCLSGNRLAMREFMILPVGAATFAEAMRIGTEVYQHLKKSIKTTYGEDAVHVGDEGSFAPNIQDTNEALDLIKKAIGAAGYTDKVEIGIDVLASEFYLEKEKKYDLNFKAKSNDGKAKFTGEQLTKLYEGYIKDYPIALIEDPFEKNDFINYSKMTAALGNKVEIVGDDLLMSNPTRVKKAIAENACNALLLKMNQIGTVTESIETVRLAKQAKWGVVIGNRLGDTEDTFIADLAVGLSTGQIKVGAPCRSERTAKYNQLLRIEEELGSKAKFAGKNFRYPSPAY